MDGHEPRRFCPSRSHVDHRMNTPVTIRAATVGPRHHLFGFHDLVQWNARGDRMLALEVEDISHPPLPGQAALSGVVDPETQAFIPVAPTTAFNYPQGSRQQWIGEGNLFLFNDRVGESWGSRIADADTRRVVETLPFAVHTCDPATGRTFGINYARLHRVGGYGYVGLPDLGAASDIPDDDGIHCGELRTGTCSLLVSIRAVAACGERQPVMTGYPHYLTHLLLNPARTRLAFLHRYRLPDGGEATRLMTVGTDGTGLRCLAKGFLSHFDWLDDGTVFIWGRMDGGMANLRENPLLRLPVVRDALRLAKRSVRGLLGRTTSVLQVSFLRVRDVAGGVPQPVARGVLTEDGHPMVCPAARDWLVNDTYPDAQGERTLMLYNHVQNRRIDLGRFRMLDARPGPVAEAFEGVDPRIRRQFSDTQYLFTRSGYHCDLHPRWKGDGTAVAFDSIHEGTRQIYVADVRGICL